MADDPVAASDFVVFVSYSRRDEHTALLLEREIGAVAGVRVWIDTARIDPGDPIHRNIEAALNESNCLIALLTQHSIESVEVREELVRADERRIPIVAVREAAIDVNQLPHFLRDKLFIEFEANSSQPQTRELLSRVRQTVAKLKQQAVATKLNAAARELADLRRTLLTWADTELFRAEIVGNVVARTREEVHGILGPDYNIDIGLEGAFLLRANPLFHNAQRVYAVSYDRISTFWRNQTLMASAKSYLNNHPVSTVRLFVFSTQAEAHRYRLILDVHARHYNTDGAVLMCSVDAYIDLIQRFISQRDKVATVLTKDFGVLDFGNRIVEATLSETSLSFRYVDESRSGLIDHRRFMEVMNRLKSIPPGEWDNECCVGKWSPELLGNQRAWATMLAKLFPHPTRDLQHLVFFTCRSGARGARNTIAAIKAKLLTLDEPFRPREIWFGKNTHTDAVDRGTGGPLKSSDEFPFALMMRFDNAQQLREYQGILSHSMIRQDLYSGFDDRIQELFQVIKELDLDSIKKAKLFDVIEDIVQQYMVRMDFIDDTDVESIVQEPWYPF